MSDQQHAYAVMAKDSRGGYVIVEATPVHARACPNWRLGKSHGPCSCGASDLWVQHQERARAAIEFALDPNAERQRRLAPILELAHQYHGHLPPFPLCHNPLCEALSMAAFSPSMGARRCGCTVDAELGAGSTCPSCGHRDHGRSGCAG